jgi:hypothetical protein
MWAALALFSRLELIVAASRTQDYVNESVQWFGYNSQTFLGCAAPLPAR